MSGKIGRIIALAAALAFSATSAAEAAIGDGILGARQPLAHMTQVEKAQFVLGGRNFCFYASGWKGPGFYWCGYANRRGLGWGGAEGWNGWRRGGVGGGFHGGVVHRGGRGGFHGGFHGGHGGGHHGGRHGGGHHGGGHHGHGGHGSRR
jgi:hypothetical protein